MTVDQIFKTLVEWHGKSAAAFGEEINVSRSTMSLILKGKSEPRLKTLANVIERFPEVNAKWLLTGKGEMFINNTSDYNLANKPLAEYKKDELNELRNQLKKTEKNLSESLKHNTMLLKLLDSQKSGK